MARTISKSIASATVYILDPMKEFKLDENGVPIANVIMHLDGNPSANKARIAAEKFCKSKNIMVTKIEVDETKLTVSPDVFIAHSKICKENETYGREYITQTFKVTYIDGLFMDENVMKVFNVEYNGETTQNKLLNYVRETFNQTAIITNTKVLDERRYMLREDYLKLAK